MGIKQSHAGRAAVAVRGTKHAGVTAKQTVRIK